MAGGKRKNYRCTVTRGEVRCTLKSEVKLEVKRYDAREKHVRTNIPCTVNGSVLLQICHVHFDLIFQRVTRCLQERLFRDGYLMFRCDYRPRGRLGRMGKCYFKWHIIVAVRPGNPFAKNHQNMRSKPWKNVCLKVWLLGVLLNRF